MIFVFKRNPKIFTYSLYIVFIKEVVTDFNNYKVGKTFTSYMQKWKLEAE